MARIIPKIDSNFELDVTRLPETEGGAVRWDLVFGRRAPLRVEIGVGNSNFLIDLAARDPQFNYVGFEHSHKRVLRFLCRVEKSGMDMLRVLRISAEVVFDRIFEPCTADHVYIHHPDPWPKRRHATRRFVNPVNARRILWLLAPGGGLSLRTDVESYALDMLRVLDEVDGMENRHGRATFAPQPLDPFRTAFEEKFIAEGRPIFYLEYRKVPDEQGSRPHVT
jgi:tRNA (guanine-N7-)-methyltransferase